MYTREDMEREESESAWIDEITVEAISDFQVERLASYYHEAQHEKAVVTGPGLISLTDEGRLGLFRLRENRDAHSRRAPSRLVPGGTGRRAGHLPGHH